MTIFLLIEFPDKHGTEPTDYFLFSTLAKAEEYADASGIDSDLWVIHEMQVDPSPTAAC